MVINMKKRIFVLFIAAVLMILTSCGDSFIEYEFETYTDFNGVDPTGRVQLDDGVKLDGVLDEAIWNKNTAIGISGATTDQTTKEPIDVSIYGQRSATVYTYIGEKNIYFAFDVKDKNLYYNSTQAQGNSTCVELYFTNRAQKTMSKGCYSVRVNPTGLEGDDAVNIGVYVPNAAGNNWNSTRMRGKVSAAVKVDGKVKNDANDRLYDTSENVGYVVEIAISKALIGESEQAVRFAAAFVQDKGFDIPRLNNTFIKNTHYIKPSTWIIMTNNGQSAV